MDDIVKDFLIESRENLDRLDQELVSLESDPNSKDLLASIFRTIHTIKGSCGFLGFARLEKVAHTGESLLSKLRDGTLSLTAEITSGLLAMIDAVRRMLNEIQSTESDGQNDYLELQQRLRNLQAAKVDSGVATAQKPLDPDSPTSSPTSSIWSSDSRSRSCCMRFILHSRHVCGAGLFKRTFAGWYPNNTISSVCRQDWRIAGESRLYRRRRLGACSAGAGTR